MQHVTSNYKDDDKILTLRSSNMRCVTILTINVPLFKKMREIIFFLRDNNFLSRFKGHFEGAKTFLTP